jgi:transglutaminase-like putative cysteine protease
MELWMQPQRSASQRLVSFELELDPAAQVFSYADSFGNAVYHFDAPRPHDRLQIIARSAVETHVPDPAPEALDQGEWDRLKSDFVRGECFDFMHPHGYARRTGAGSPDRQKGTRRSAASRSPHRRPPPEPGRL